MNDLDAAAFTQLFKDAYEKCFGYPLKTQVTETESKLLSNQVIDETGLVIGFKSIKNYSSFIFDTDGTKKENPSVATLDTLSRYVLNAPVTNEALRKKNESHYPYWFTYKDKFYRTITPPPETKPAKRMVAPAVAGVVVLVLVSAAVFYFTRPAKAAVFTDDFHAVDEDTLNANGWFVKLPDTAYWGRRAENTGLTLFTLKGDNWPDSAHSPGIKNLLLRSLESDCFSAEMHLEKFIPRQNWQQAGLILLEDTGFAGKSLRFSILFNDYAGASPKLKQLIIQAITSPGKGFTKPEEIAHVIFAQPDSIDKNPALKADLDNAALRVEKQGGTVRLLFAGGKMANSAFREIVSRAIDFKPRYIGIFAMRGFTDSAESMPVHVRFFRLTGEKCGE